MYNTEFVYQKEIGKTYNRNFIVNKIGSREKWVGKISKSLEEKGVYFSDLNYRAILANRLANILNIPMPDYRIVEREKIDKHGNLLEFENSNSHTRKHAVSGLTTTFFCQ